MKASLLLWVAIEIVKNDPRRQVTGFTHCTHPLNARWAQLSFPLDEWKIIEEKPNGEVILEVRASPRA